jgi:Tfp pilus assembly protein, pilus retraction ATPase PilT
MDISKLLTFTAKEGASDCHISAGEPPMIRMNGDLKKLDHPALTTEETHALIYDMMSDTQRKNFEEKRECDFSFELGDIARSASMSSSKTAGLALSSETFPPRSFRWKSSACLRSCDSSAIGKRG